MPGEPMAPPPLPFLTLKDIVHGACDQTLSAVTSYDHGRVETWNSEIISSVLSSLVSATTPSGSAQPPYKYSVHSTTIQDLSSTSSASTSAQSSDPSSASRSEPAESQSRSSTKEVGRRGMHAAAAGYWDNTRDGMWSYKYEAATGKGLDVMVAVVWIWVGSPDSAGPGPAAAAADGAASAAAPTG